MREPRPGTSIVPSFVVGSYAKGDFPFLFLGALSGSPERRSTPELRLLERLGERLAISDLFPSSREGRTGGGLLYMRLVPSCGL